MTGRFARGACLVALLAGCATGPGTGFATVVPGPLTAALDLPEGRRDGADGWKTSNGYVVRLEGGMLTLEPAAYALQAPGQAATAGTGAVFDPAKPPAGYTLCHGGHCHRTDGALIDYAVIQAELASGGAAAPPRTVLSVPVPQGLRVPLTGEAAVTPGACEPNCFLAKGAISQTALGLKRLVAAGRVEAAAGTAALPGGVQAFTLALPLDGVALAGATARTLDRDQPAQLTLTGKLKLPQTLFDGLDWARLAASGAPIALGDDATSRETLLASAAKITFTPQLAP